ncbi:MAG: PH domain-containing protein [Acidimicrobiia bacterium]|nr:PH domain-containing protein [Acidimicrobiia bacterium]
MASARFQIAVLLGSGLVAAIVVTFLSVVVVVIRNLVERYGFTVVLRGDDLHLRFGLFEVRKLTVPRRRVQHVTVVDNPIRHALGLASLELRTASATGGGSEGFEIPLVRRADVDDLVTEMMGDDAWREPEIASRPPRARGRGIRRRCLAIALLVAPPAVLLFPAGLVVLALAALGVRGASWRTAEPGTASRRPWSGSPTACSSTGPISSHWPASRARAPRPRRSSGTPTWPPCRSTSPDARARHSSTTWTGRRRGS